MTTGVRPRLSLRAAPSPPDSRAAAESRLLLAACLLLASRVWPVIFAGAFLVNLTTTGGLGISFGIASGNTLEALLGRC